MAKIEVGRVRIGPMYVTVATAQRIAGLIGALAKEPGWRTTIYQYQVIEEAVEQLAVKYKVQASEQAEMEYRVHKAKHQVQDWSIDLKGFTNPEEEALNEWHGWKPGTPPPWEKKNG